MTEPGSDDAADRSADTDGNADPPQPQEATRCLRCRRIVPIDDDGFCEPCLKEIDQACL